MKEKFKLWDKVKIPKTKGLGCEYIHSGAIKGAKKEKLDFLYITYLPQDGITCSLWYNQTAGGDNFLLEELEPYEEQLQYEIY